MSEMVDRVAQAITWELANQNLLMVDRRQHTVSAMALARAAIAAMWEPTEAMLRLDWTYEPSDRDLWQAMITAALEPARAEAPAE